MNTYTPDAWVIVEIYDGKSAPYLKVLAGWYGGFAGANSWKLNSGITSVKETDTYWEFEGHTGSTYICYKGIQRLTSMTSSILAQMQKEIEKIPNGYVKVKDF